MTQVYSAASPHAEPLPQEVSVFKDNDWSLICIVVNALDGQPFDLLTWQGWLGVKDRDTYHDDQMLIFKRTDVSGEGEILSPTAEGRFRVDFERGDTAHLKAGMYFCDFGIFRGAEKVTAGKIQLALKQGILHGDVLP